MKRFNWLLFAVLAGTLLFYFICIRFSLLTLKASSVAPDSQTQAPDTNMPTFDDLLDAIEWVESGGDSNAVGSYGEVGVYQLCQIFVDDVKRITDFPIRGWNSLEGVYREITWPDPPDIRLDKASCRCLIFIYLKHYATYARLNKEPTFEDLARIFNGGPNGWKKDCTKPYWRKVKARMAGDAK